MREILFKAKRKDNGEWVEGNTFFADNGQCEICIGTPIVRITYEVDPETVCQYTGLTDKNGNKIFEKDVVKAVSCIRYGREYIVKWNDYGYTLFDYETGFEPTDVVVIGNIHDEED